MMMSASPCFRAVILPSESTDATFGSEEAKETAPAEPLLRVYSSVQESSAPMETCSMEGVTDCGAAMISMATLFFFPLKVVAVTVASPGSRAVSRPSGVTLAALPAQEKLTLPALPLESL